MTSKNGGTLKWSWTVVHPAAVCSACIIMLALSGRQCTRTTAALAYAASSPEIEPGSSTCAELHDWADRTIELYHSADRMPLGQCFGCRYVSRDVTGYAM